MVERKFGMDRLIAEREAVESWQVLTETALQQEFGKTNESLAFIAGKLSIMPDSVHPNINKRSLLWECVDFSFELQASFSRIGVASEVQGSSSNQVDAMHVYVTPRDNPHDIIIDPTIGQIIQGYNHVFVGTRPQLRNLLYAQMNDDAQYGLTGYYDDNFEVMYRNLWGYSSTRAEEYANPIRPSYDSKSVIVNDSFLNAILKTTPLLRNT